ncbi:hypothetical protein BASA81_000207 [Batrachochytrium salamandrivorans]|nr:hypothetical protein BASA81_000207 [Batrachochytrium salamandrivorans]
MQLITFFLLLLSSTALGVQHKRLAGLTDAFCTLQTDGQVFCAGNNGFGNLGLGSLIQQIPTPLQMLTVTAATDICMGDSHTCLVDQGGQAKCVGSNRYDNQLGDGTNVDKTVLANVLGLETGVSQIFAGPQTSCALLDGGGARCWGSNFYGALGGWYNDKLPLSPFKSRVLRPVGCNSSHWERSIRVFCLPWARFGARETMAMGSWAPTLRLTLTSPCQ